MSDVHRILFDTKRTANLSVPPSEAWLDTGIHYDSMRRLKVVADGQVDLWAQTPGQYVTGPRGYTSAGKNSSYMAGTLIGKVGENGQDFSIGDLYEGQPNGSGKLYLKIIGSPWQGSEPSGSYSVRASVNPR